MDFRFTIFDFNSSIGFSTITGGLPAQERHIKTLVSWCLCGKKEMGYGKFLQR